VAPPDLPPQPLQPAAPLRWDIFCRVIDNHGDLGVCWRFATDLAARGQQVRLWVDDACALAWMAPQGHVNVQLRDWADAFGDGAGTEVDPGDVVVEAFGCDPPASFVARMAAKAARGDRSGGAPVWINLEYLSAESYVERSHGLASPQFNGPGAGLTKWFWYPGFTRRTGGLLREPGQLETLRGFDRQTARADLLRRFDPALATGHGGTPTIGHAADVDPLQARLALLFCYDNPALPAWLDAMSRAERPWCVLVTPGLAMQGVARWWQARTAQSFSLSDAHSGAQAAAMRLGSLSLLPLAHVDQQQFDDLLWACDLNFVRGEDSFVRAHWAGRPFVWQAYVQDDGAQHAKIAAWLQVYAGAAPDEQLRRALNAAHLAWNSAPGVRPADSDAVLRELFGRCDVDDKAVWSSWRNWADSRRVELAGQGDLVSQLLRFVAAKRGAAQP
jgi:uncharacterized repeat protein (TIGR03837 family)